MEAMDPGPNAEGGIPRGGPASGVFQAFGVQEVRQARGFRTPFRGFGFNPACTFSRLHRTPSFIHPARILGSGHCRKPEHSYYEAG